MVSLVFLVAYSWFTQENGKEQSGFSALEVWVPWTHGVPLDCPRVSPADSCRRHTWYFLQGKKKEKKEKGVLIGKCVMPAISDEIIMFLVQGEQSTQYVLKKEKILKTMGKYFFNIPLWTIPNPSRAMYWLIKSYCSLIARN